MNALRLLLPVLFPSWRFFPEVGPSPRIEYALLGGAEDKPSAWAAFQPRPDTQSFIQFANSLFWNPTGNTYLFLVTCCEQFLANNSQPALDHLTAHVREGAIKKSRADTHDHFQFRLIVVFRDGEEVKREELYRSSVLSLSELSGT